MEKLKRIDKDLTKLQNELNEISDVLKFSNSIEFDLSNCGNNIKLESLSFSGIYMLEIKNDGKFNEFEEWLTEFRKCWEGEDKMYIHKFVPNLKKKRIMQHKELNEWIPIYIGKSRNIKDRIHQHIYGKLEKNTFALKLIDRQNLNNETFRLSYLELPVENYDWIIPKIEHRLRDKYNPIIGKQ